MNEQEKRDYLESYHQAKEKGVPFFPDILFKDAVISLLIFLILAALAYFVGAPLEARANPADTTYTPRPEWYFLFLFQMLKYFPGKLEVVGVVVLPTLGILFLLALPLLDRSPRRYFVNRPVISALAGLAVTGIVALTVLAIRESPPPAEATAGDQTAMLYARNCAPCHGATITVAADTNLHAIIAQGKHEGMPAWSSDLTTDQIDALAGFILSPGGSRLFAENCAACHDVAELVAGAPLQLKNALEQGKNFPPHLDIAVPEWSEVMDQPQRTALLNFLVAPDGQRLFAVDCSPCHGRAVAFAGDENELRAIISKGGLHLEMPPWQEKLSDAEMTALASYVVDPASLPEGKKSFQQFCSACHGARVPKAANLDEARQIIAGGGPHQTMPVWGEVLTAEQLDALVVYTLSAAKGTSLEVGQELFSRNCAPCHGDFGEGGPNPAIPADIIAPISTAEFLKTRDDFTLRAVTAQGQPNFGMSPFGSAFGGPLDGDDIDAIVAYMRSWEANPPVEIPPEVSTAPISLSGKELFGEVCAQCHGANGEGRIGPALREAQFQKRNTDQDIFDTINLGHAATPMIAWGEILTAKQIQQLVEFIRELGQAAPAESPAGPPTFANDVLPIFEAKCEVCHGTLGGWNGTSYTKAMESGDHAPVVVPKDVAGSLLAQKLLGTQTTGAIMPPAGKLPEAEVQIILDWIAAGAPEK